MMFFVLLPAKRQSVVCDGQENVKNTPETGVYICLEGIERHCRHNGIYATRKCTTQGVIVHFNLFFFVTIQKKCIFALYILS